VIEYRVSHGLTGVCAARRFMWTHGIAAHRCVWCGAFSSKHFQPRVFVRPSRIKALCSFANHYVAGWRHYNSWSHLWWLNHVGGLNDMVHGVTVTPKRWVCSWRIEQSNAAQLARKSAAKGWRVHNQNQDKVFCVNMLNRIWPARM